MPHEPPTKKQKTVPAQHTKTNNHVVKRPYGITELKLVASNKQASVSHVAPASGKAGEKPGAGDTFVFAPSVEKMTIHYIINDVSKRTNKAELELFDLFEPTVLWKKTLTAGEYANGPHDLIWDGKVDVSPRFPDGFVTLEYSGYKLRLTLTGDGLPDPPYAWTFFQVEVADITLELGSKEDLTQKRDTTVYDQLLNVLPAPGAIRELRLVSNLFKTDSIQMYTKWHALKTRPTEQLDEMTDVPHTPANKMVTYNTDFAFDAYEKEWGKGPNVPVYAHIKLKDTSRKAVDAPKALGKTKFLWDWEDAHTDMPGMNGTAANFVQLAEDYQSNSLPPGKNCHVERGGKRGRLGDPVFPVQAGYTPSASLQAGKFPFKVERTTVRSWAGFSYAWTSGKLEGKTGALFQPSRMAGDACKVTVYVANERTVNNNIVLDTQNVAPLPAAHKASTGTFQIWREIHLAQYIRKVASLPNLVTAIWPAVQGYYHPASIDMKDKTAGRVTTMNQARYDAAFKTALQKLPPLLRDYAVDYTRSQYVGVGTPADPSPASLMFRDYADMLLAVKSMYVKTARKTYPKWTQVQWDSWADTRTAQWETDKYPGGAQEYAKDVDNVATDVVEEGIGLLRYLSKAAEGVTIAHFVGVHNLEGLLGTHTVGLAADVPDRNLHKCLFLAWDTDAETTAHEIGHQLFLPHSPHPTAANNPHNDPIPGGGAPLQHDDADATCIMTYTTGADHFCGLCLLRLRGWRAQALLPQAAQNQKT